MKKVLNWSALLNKSILILVIVAITACAQAPVATAPATQQVITVALPASLDPLASGLKSCAADQPGLSLFIDDNSSETSSASDFNITFGEPISSAKFSASLAVEDVVVVLNRSNKLNALSTGDLRKIYSGQTSTWQELSSDLGEIQVWDYASSDPLHHIFDQAVLAGSPVTGKAYLAPDPSAMLDSISSNPVAIGYLPRAWVDNNVTSIKLETDVSTALRLPVLVLASQEPQGILRTFVACLQTGKGHTIIMQHYQPANP